MKAVNVNTKTNATDFIELVCICFLDAYPNLSILVSKLERKHVKWTKQVSGVLLIAMVSDEA